MTTEPTLDELATTYLTLLWDASNVDSDGDVFEHLLSAASHVAERIKIWAGLPSSAVLREMPYTEVCLHMRVAGQPMWTVPVGVNGMQLYTLAGRRFSFPITDGEAGVHLIDSILYENPHRMADN